MTRFLPYGRQLIEDDDVQAVVEALKSDFLTTGPRVEAFEAALAEAVGAEHAVVCNSGTAALHLAAMALGLGPGDQVLVPAVTFLATANAPGFTGAEVVFADVDPRTGLITPQLLEAALARAPRAKACFPVHLNGHPCDIAGLAEVAARRGVALVDDACHALGARYADGGVIGDGKSTPLTAFSFHPVKSIAMGEGGAVTTDDAELAHRCRRLRSHGMERDPSRFTSEIEPWAEDSDGRRNAWIYEMDAPGYNYRAPDVLCALGLSQLRKLGRFLDRRRALAALYDRALQPLSALVEPVRCPRPDLSGWHLYVARVDFDAAGRSRAAVMQALADQGLGTQVHYLPVHLQPYYRRQSPNLGLPGALAYYEQCLSLPFYPAMADEDVARVAEGLAVALGLA